ncbi:uncharacterized protein LOC133197277 [Saccostrea echinata]|uniref:uncharacterized protein LOC133197277 n=1 Tax=Saccostrea echinata TaxID=191078 RepID=UPI002A80A1EC|nr:uncharacterized protein LOC133197277 [Saccostrea echinata]
MEQKISHLLQSAIISLCSQHYTEKLEVDGIICISSQQSNFQHVVKIHQKVEPSNSLYSQRVSRDSSPAPPPKSVAPWTEQQIKVGTPAEKTKSRKRSRNTEDNDPDFNCNISSSVDNFPTIVKQLHKRKSRAQKISSYTEYDTDGSESPGYGSDVQDGRYGVSDSNVGKEPMGSASVLLKLLAKPHKRSMLANQSNSIPPSIEMVNLEGASKAGMEYQIRLNDGAVTSREHVPEGEDTTKSVIPTVKEEPVWDGEYGGMDQQEQNSECDENKKDDSSAGANSDSSEKNSILMKILEGKSLREAYKSENSPSPGLQSQNLEEKSKSSEQENSLLYRLPFVSFQDLFPQNSQDILPNENNTVRKESGGPKKPLTLQTLEYTKTGGVPTSQGYTGTPTHKTDQKYSTRLSSGKKNPVSYQEMLGTVSYSSDDEKDQGERDLDDEMYTPQQSEYQLMTQEADMMEVNTGAKRRKMGPRSKVSNKQDNFKGINGKGSERSKPTVVCSNDRFECSICGRIFNNRALRDMHEDAERAEHFFKCPLCDGFFGSEESKLIHMQDRHGVATKEFAEERANKKLVAAKNKSLAKKKEALQAKKTLLSQDEENGPVGNGSRDDSQESFSVEVKEEKMDENSIECDMCDMTFLGLDELKAHTQSFHGAV